MEEILFLAHSEGESRLSKASLEALTAARNLTAALEGSRLSVGLFGETPQTAADGIAACGAATFLAVAGPEFEVPRYATDAAAAEALVRASGATVVLAPASTRVNRALPGVAQRLSGRIDTQVTGLHGDAGAVQVERWFYRQRLSARLTRQTRPWLLTVAGGTFTPFSGAPDAVELSLVPVEVEGEGLRTRALGEELPAAGTQTIRPDADLLLVAGAGWTKKQADGHVHCEEAEKLILAFLSRSNASLGSSKSLVDQSSEGQAVISFMSHLNQVGQTGSTPRHPKGLATCCHGEEPHVVGWRFIKERRAVNLDPGCGWAQGKADVLYVADAFQLMAKVNELLNAP